MAVARLPKPGAVAAVGVAWTVSLFVPGVFTDSEDVYAVLVIVFTLAAGIAAGTWWILLVPWIAAVVLLAIGEITSSGVPCAECNDELGLVGAAFLTAIACVLADVGLAIGAGVRKGTALVRRTRAGGA